MLLNPRLGLSQVSLQSVLLTVIVLLNLLLQALLLMMLNHLLVMINIHLSLMEISDRVTRLLTPPAGTTPLTISMTMLLTLMTMVMPAMPAMQMLVYDVAQT